MKIYSGGAAVPKAKVGLRCDSPVPGRKIHDSPQQPKSLNSDKLNAELVADTRIGVSNKSTSICMY